MKKKIRIAMLVGAFMLMPVYGQKLQTTTIAILSANNQGENPEMGAFVTRFASEVARARGYRLLERDKLSLLLSENELSQLGVTQSRADHGGLYAADQLIILSIAEVAGQRQFSARRLEGKTGLVLNHGETTAPDLRQLYARVGPLARKVLEHPSQNNEASLSFDDKSTPFQISAWPPVALFALETTVTGIAFSVLHSKQTKVLGIQAGFSNGNQELHGIEAGLINRSQHATGIQAGLVNSSEVSVTGIQVGLYNEATELRGFQFGLINRNRNGLFPVMPLINFSLASP